MSKKLKVRMVYEIEGDTTIEVPEGKYAMGSEKLIEEEKWNFIPFKNADELLKSVEGEGLVNLNEGAKMF